MKTKKKEQLEQLEEMQAGQYLHKGDIVQTKDGKVTYIIDEFLHEGGFGLIYKAHISGMELIPLVLKEFYIDSALRNSNGTLPIQYTSAGVEVVFEKFKKEPERCALLTHNEADNNHVDWANIKWEILTQHHLVHPYSRTFQATNDNWYYTMELIPGETIFQYKKRTGTLMPLTMASKILQDVCMGLELMHSRGLVHQDITPGNIMISFKDKKVNDVRLIDYGLTGSLFGKSYIVEGGTYGFMDLNECVFPKPIIYDIYSLGAVLFYMCFFDDKGRNFDEQILREFVESRKELNSRQPKDEKERKLIALIIDSLSENKAARPQTAVEFASRLKDLDSSTESAPVSSELEASVYVSPAPMPLGNDKLLQQEEEKWYKSLGKQLLQSKLLVAIWSLVVVLGLFWVTKDYFFPSPREVVNPLPAEKEKTFQEKSALPSINHEVKLTEDIKNAIDEGITREEATKRFCLSDTPKLIVGLGNDSFFEENIDVNDLFTDNTRNYHIGENYRIEHVEYSPDSLITEIIIVPIE